MAENSKIQWTDHTWNVARGCKKVDADCKYCYMYRQSLNGTRYTPDQVTKTKTVFNTPLKIKEPSKIFVSSLTDFFIEEIDSYRNEAWDIIRKTKHTFQILTKRVERVHLCYPDFWDEIKDRCWIGTSVGSEGGIERIKHLMYQKGIGKISTAFLSLEPLHGCVDLDQEFELGAVDCSAHVLDYIDWVIVGGESGNDIGKYRYRPCKIEWIENIINACKESDVPVFVKQLGTHLAKELKLKDRHGGNIEEWPEHLRIREFPIMELVK